MQERRQILHALALALEPRRDVIAMWEGGAAARNALDRWSDIDLQLVVDDDAIETVFGAVERTLEGLSPIECRFRLPEPTSHGHSQCFYRLRDTSPYLLVDLVLMRQSDENRHLEPEYHGRPVVHFDKLDVLVLPDFDVEAHRRRMERALADAMVKVELFTCFVEKELLRNQPLDAFWCYQFLILRALLLVLGIRYRPLRFDFGPRYTATDFPTAVAAEFARLHYVSDEADLRSKLATATRWFWRVATELDPVQIPLPDLSRRIRRELGLPASDPERADRA